VNSFYISDVTRPVLNPLNIVILTIDVLCNNFNPSQFYFIFLLATFKISDGLKMVLQYRNM
jgi:hypothetical protein